MKRTLYHQTENTNVSELSTYVYDYNAWEFNSPHFHMNMEILLCIEGECECFVGNSKYLLLQGDAIFIFPYRIHGFTVGAGASVRCVTFSEFLILTLAKAVEGKTATNPVFHPSEETASYFLSQMLLLFGRRNGYNKQVPMVSRMKAKGLLYMLLSEFLAEAELISDGGSTTLASEIVQYLSENFKKNISLHDIADSMGYNYQYLSRTFNKVFGINFKQMLNQYRLDHACALLQDTDLTVAQIAFESGFQSLRSFNQICLENFGKTPRELRSEAREGIKTG